MHFYVFKKVCCHLLNKRQDISPSSIKYAQSQINKEIPSLHMTNVSKNLVKNTFFYKLNSNSIYKFEYYINILVLKFITNMLINYQRFIL